MELLELIQRVITSRTNRLTGVVTNLHGAAPGLVEGLDQFQVSTWTYTELPERPNLSLDEFLSVLVATRSRASRTVETVDGEVNIPAGVKRTILLRTTADIATPNSIPLTVKRGEDRDGRYGIYLDGRLLQETGSDTEVMLTLETGAHTIEVLYTGRGGTGASVALPKTVRVMAREQAPPPPVWESIRSEYLDANTGQGAIRLSWYVDPRSGGYRVLRRAHEPLNTILDIAEPRGSGVFALIIGGDWTRQATAGMHAYAGLDLVGLITNVAYDAPLNRTYLTVQDVVDGSGTPQTLHLDPTRYIGRHASVGAFVEMARVARTFSKGVIVWRDVRVTRGTLYDYVLQAYGLFDPAVVGDFSEVRTTVAGDTTPPGPISLIQALVSSKVANIRYQTPPDEDYLATRVYYRERFVGTCTAATQNSIIDSTQSFDPDLVNGWRVRITSGPGQDEEHAIIAAGATQLTVDADWLVQPTDTSNYEVFRDTLLLTDYGLPDADDSLSFRTIDYGEYSFRTIDISLNEQSHIGALRWEYTPADDGIDGNNTPPVISIRQLGRLEQANFTTVAGNTDDYTNPLRYAIVEIGALDNDVANGTDFVRLYYQIRDMPQAPYMPAATLATQWRVDEPATFRSRFVVLDRSNGDTAITVWAVDGNGVGLTSGKFEYIVDFDNIPEISDLEDPDVDEEQNRALIRGVADDDCMGIKWWIEPDAPPAPTLAAPAHFGPTDTNKVFYFWVSVPDGGKRTLVLEPYDDWDTLLGQVKGNAGPQIRRDIIRPPRTQVTWQPRDEMGAPSSTRIKLMLKMIPEAKTVVTGTLTSVGVNSITDTSKSWTPNQYTSSGNKYFFVRITSGPAAGYIRKIISQTAPTQALVDGTWPVMPQAGNTYEIRDGASFWRLDGTGAFYPAREAEYFNREEGALKGRTVDFYSVLNGCPPERVQRWAIDEDKDAEITIAYQYFPSIQKRVVSVTDFDDDCVSWRLYERKGGWPTMTGGQADALDDRYKKWDGTLDTRDVDNYTETAGTYYAIAVARNGDGVDGPRAFATLNTGGVVTDPGQLSGFGFAVTGGTGTAISWTHNDAVDTGNMLVRVYGYRVDRGAGTEVEITSGLRSAELDESGSDTTPLRGAVVHTGVGARSGSGIEYTWRYRVLLYTSGGALVGTYANLDYTDTYAGSATSLTGAAATISSPGSCDLLTFNCTTAHVRQITWTTTATDDAVYSITINVALDGGPYIPLATNLLPSSGMYHDLSNCYYAKAGAPTRSWQYQVQLITRSSGAVAGTQTTALVSGEFGACAPPNTGGDGQF